MTIEDVPSLTEFMKARIKEDLTWAWKKTVTISGGHPASEIPNCVGFWGNGCPESWRLDPPENAEPFWWDTPENRALVREHEKTHQSEKFKRNRREAVAKKEIVDIYGVDDWTHPVMRILGAIYADHPDYRPEWR